MSQNLHDDDEKPLDPAAARIVAKVRGLMLIGGATMLIGIAAIFAVIGYRVFKSEGSAPAAIAGGTIALPKDARVIASTVSEGRIAVTVQNGAATELHLFDLKTLKPAGRFTLQTGP